VSGLSTDFEELDRILARWGAAVGAAEAHGILCGLCCHREGPSLVAFFQQVVGEGAPGAGVIPEVDREFLVQVAAETRESFRSLDYDFALILPADEKTVDARIQALAEWSQGFLYGIGNTGVDFAGFGEDPLSFLRDLNAISRAGPSDAEDAEEDEAALVEVIEYVRAGAMLLWEEAQAAAD
jgi:hypothetical protein